MPIYQFVCNLCEHTFEFTRRITNAPKAEDLTCPKCQIGEVEQSWEGGNLVWNFVEKFR